MSEIALIRLYGRRVFADHFYSFRVLSLMHIILQALALAIQLPQPCKGALTPYNMKRLRMLLSNR